MSFSSKIISKLDSTSVLLDVTVSNATKEKFLSNICKELAFSAHHYQTVDI